MKIDLRDHTTIEEVLCIIPLEPDDWLVKFYYFQFMAFGQAIGSGKRIEEMHVDPDMVMKVYE